MCSSCLHELTTSAFTTRGRRRFESTEVPGRNKQRLRRKIAPTASTYQFPFVRATVISSPAISNASSPPERVSSEQFAQDIRETVDLHCIDLSSVPFRIRESWGSANFPFPREGVWNVSTAVKVPLPREQTRQIIHGTGRKT